MRLVPKTFLPKPELECIDPCDFADACERDPMAVVRLADGTLILLGDGDAVVRTTEEVCVRLHLRAA